MGTWKMESFTTTELSKKLRSDKEIKIPKFQRNLVWKPKQKEMFIDSIKKGYPFGSILLYKDNEGSFQLIDGLQRSNTIHDFINNPSEFFNESDIDPDIIVEIVKKLDINSNISKVEDEIKKMLIDWIKEHGTMDDIIGIQYIEFSFYLREYFPTAENVLKEISDLIKPMLDDFISVCKDLSNAKVPALVFEGDSSVLPEVFERINSKGTQLSKYQIYAATWISQDDIEITSEEIKPVIEHVKKRYDAMIEKEYYIDDYDPNDLTKNKKVDVFNVIFGFGKILTNRFPYLFGEDNDEEKVVGEAFTIVNACLGKRTSELENLHNNIFDEFNGSHEKINIFLQKVLETIKQVDNKFLRGIHKFKGNKRLNSKKSPLHTELQISSIIAAAFLLQYGNYKTNDNGEQFVESLTLKQKQKSWSKEYKNLLENNLYKIYVMDILQQKWRGSGDKTLNTLIYYPEKYTREVKWDEFNSAITHWFNRIINDRQEREKVKGPREEEKVFLNLLYLKKFNAYQHLSNDKFDYEHLATKNMLKKKLENLPAKCTLPISSIGNLCLLPEYINRSKKDKLLFEDEEYIEKLNHKGLSTEDLIYKYSLMDKTDLDWLNEDFKDCKLLKEYYKGFINKRFKNMKRSIEMDFFTNNQ